MSLHITVPAGRWHAVLILAKTQESHRQGSPGVNCLWDFNKQAIDICLEPMLDCTIGLYRKAQMDFGEKKPLTKIHTMGEVSTII